MLYRIVLIYLTDNEQLMLYQSVCQSYFSFLFQSLFDLLRSLYVRSLKSCLLNLLLFLCVITFVLTIDFFIISLIYYSVVTFVFSIDFLPSSSSLLFDLYSSRGSVGIFPTPTVLLSVWYFSNFLLLSLRLLEYVITLTYIDLLVGSICVCCHPILSIDL